ncbi:MAG: 30S ribosomal protein S4 [Betaproteobacteria bacterium AqS2]|uniref:Small ribosomal subunit protein uS4 n=1 Tax=Candidatus Amphirhobacter heronislandensis TaxID=1732024 RepID=A0A930UDA3_9GAMM|nr:30S ribosomal protein S4 [Betaproteobacteria bacterium AqS2]
MAKYLGPKLRLSRREGEDLGFKSGVRPIEQKCNLKTKPGEPPRNIRPRASDYQSHLRAKQKMRRYYGLLEKQFRNYYLKAAKAKGDTGSNLIDMLERRLDNVVYRLGFARTRAEARQIVSHKLITVDGAPVNIASYQVGDGQTVAVAPKARGYARIKDAQAVAAQQRPDYEWLRPDVDACAGTLVAAPDKTMLGVFFDEGMVIEYYSK